MDEFHFLLEINAIPWEQPEGNGDYRSALLVFSDWLEERGDPRAELIRLREGLLNNPTLEQRTIWEPRMQELIHTGRQPIQATWENSLHMRFSWCPPGTFMMGSPKDEVDRHDDEDQVEVAISQGFWLGKYQVMRGEWWPIMGKQLWSWESDAQEVYREPVSNASWNEAEEFCRKLTKHEQDAGCLPIGWVYRLPTEAQWEYGCRAGTTSAYCFGNDVAKLDEYAWYHRRNSLFWGQKVGQKLGNAWGLYDMHGNVWEWCSNWYAKKLVSGDGVSCKPEEQATHRAYRGGSWRNSAIFCRSANRYHFTPDPANGNVGLRVIVVQED